MVTDLQFYNAVKSYYYRTGLIENLEYLEQRIKCYMTDRRLQKTSLPGYIIEMSDKNIAIKEQPMPVINQLKIEFSQEKTL